MDRKRERQCTVWPKFNVTEIVLLGKLWTAYLMVQSRFQYLLFIEDTYTHFCLYLIGNFVLHFCLSFTGWGHTNHPNMPCTEAIKRNPERNCTYIWADSILISNLMHWLLFLHKILFFSTCFKPQVLIFRRIQLYTCSIWYCHSLWEFLVACQYTAVYRQATRNSPREWQYHMLHVYNCVLLKMSTWCSKHVEENSILWINNNQCIKLAINM